MRLSAFLVVALLLAGCGAATTAPGSSGESPTLAQPSYSTETSEPDLTPPLVFLVSEAGKQRAAQGSSCVSGEGVGACGDTGPMVPEAMTVVQPGDNVVITIPGATLGKDSSITIQPLGCHDRAVERLDFPENGELHWPVDLEPGGYQLDVFALFEAGNGLHGDVSGSLGLLVGGGPKTHDYTGIAGLDKTLAVCPF